MVRNTRLPPGFRFHPTDVELVQFYLKRRVMGKKLPFDCIAEIDIYKHAPWDLPHKSLLRTGDLKWYFFCPREKKYASGSRMNRATDFGFWKTTGKDRTVRYDNEVSGMIKTLVFHQGKAPKGDRTDWVMYEYRLEDKRLTDSGVDQGSYVLSVIFKKDGPGPKNGAQYGAPFKEADWESDDDGEEMIDIGTALFAGGSAPSTVLSIDRNNSAVTSPVMPDGSCVVSPLSCPSEKAIACDVPVTPDSNNATPGVSQAPLFDHEVVCRAEPPPPSEDIPQGEVLASEDVLQAPPVGRTVYDELLFGAAAVGSGAVRESEDKEDDLLAMLAYFSEEVPFTLNDLNDSEVINNPNEGGVVTPGPSLTAGPGVDGGDIYTSLGDVWNLGPFGEYQNGYNADQSVVNHMLSGGNDDYLELMDLETPLNGFQQQGNGIGDIQAGGMHGGSGSNSSNNNNDNGESSVCEDWVEFVNSCWKHAAAP